MTKFNISKGDNGYMIITIGSKAKQYVDRMLHGIGRTNEFKDHTKILESIREGYGDVIVTIDDELKLSVAFSLDDETLAIPALEEFLVKVRSGEITA